MSAQIMVPLDGSPFSEQALNYAYQVARRMSATVHLVRVQSPEVLTAEASFFNVQRAPAIREAEQEYLAKIRGAGPWQVRTTITNVLGGPVVDALAVYVREHAIDLVIMTTHGRGGLSRAWLGSVADQLIRQVSIPILLLRPSQGGMTMPGLRFELEHIVIPLDGSAESERALEPAIALGNLTGARYTLLQIVEPLALIAVSDGLPIPMQKEQYEELRMSAAAYLDRVAERLRSEGYLVDTAVVIQHQCAAGILEQAVSTDASLIAMATHGRSGFRRLALGSVADKVLRGTSVPLLLLRPENRELALSASA